MPGHGVEVETWAPDPGPLNGLASRWYGRRYRARVRELIRGFRPDVVHAHNVWMRLSPVPLAAADEAGVPVVMTVHDYAWVCPRKWMIAADDRPCELGFGRRCLASGCRGSHEGRLWWPYNALRWLKTWWHRTLLAGSVDRFVSPSRHLGRWMERSLGIDEVLHVPNCAGPPAGGVHRPVTHPRTLAFAGRLSREKGVDLLLRAMVEVIARHPEARLHVAGDGAERESLQRLTVGLGLTDAVSFAGALAPAEVGELYAASGLVVLPTIWMENCPVSVLEAFAHGRAVVATRIGGVPELVEDGRTGALFDRGDVRGLGRRLVELLDDPDRVTTMGERARAVWQHSYTPEVHARRLRGVYDSLLGERRPAVVSGSRLDSDDGAGSRGL